MRRETNFFKQLDWWSVVLYLALVVIGWISIFSAVYDPEHGRIIDTTQRYGMQLIWMVSAWALAIIVLTIPARIYPMFSGIVYVLGIILLMSVLVLGAERNGSKSWLVLGPVNFQPAELSKVFVAMALALLMSQPHFKLKSWRGSLQTAALILFPALLILMEKETGLALVYASFLLVLYREGLPSWILVFGLAIVGIFLLTIVLPLLTVLWVILIGCSLVTILLSVKKWPIFLRLGIFTLLFFGVPRLLSLVGIDVYAYVEPAQLFIGLSILLLLFSLIYAFVKRISHLKVVALCAVCAMGFTFSVDFIFNNIVQPHQRARIENLLGIDKDIYGTGYNVHQSKIAIGSGGLLGKGFLKGTQTKFNFVPEQSTDFIFCTIGEEWGFVGASVVVVLYLLLLLRIIAIAERQKSAYGRIYGYCVASFIFFHVFINIGMTLGIMPVIGIPLPFISYGGSSLWTFTLLLFILLRLDTSRQ